MGMQEMIFNIAYVCIIIMLVIVLGMDIMKKRKYKTSSEREEENLPTTLAELPAEDFVILKDVNLMTKLGKSRADYIIASVYGIFAVEFRAFYLYIGGNEYTRKWKKTMRFLKEEFSSPLWTAKVHNLAVRDALHEAGLQKEEERFLAVAGFPNCADLKVLSIEEETSFAGNTDDLTIWIESWDEEGTIYTRPELKKVVSAIKAYSDKVENMPAPEPVSLKLEDLPEEIKEFTRWNDDVEYEKARKDAALARFIEEEEAEEEYEDDEKK